LATAGRAKFVNQELECLATGHLQEERETSMLGVGPAAMGEGFADRVMPTVTEASW
jgi:hypothetical protein